MLSGGTSMTLAALLEVLKEVDAKTYDDISHLELIGWQQPRNQAMDHLQGCIQRACEKRGWCFMVCNHIADVSTEKDIYDSETHDYPAEALLAAYVAAVKEATR
jgi:hypothetical protein